MYTCTAAVHTSPHAGLIIDTIYGTGWGSADLAGCEGLFPDCSPVQSFRELKRSLGNHGRVIMAAHYL